PRHWHGDSAQFRRRTPDRSRVSVSSVAAPGAGEAHLVRMGQLGQQSSGALLQADACRPRAPRRRNQQMGKDGASGRSCPQSERRNAMTLPHWLRWRQDRELDEEINAHLDQEIRDNLDRGLTLDQARSAALRRFGNRSQVMERVREGDPFFGLETVGRDVLYGLRSLRRNPAFAAGATLSLPPGLRGKRL